MAHRSSGCGAFRLSGESSLLDVVRLAAHHPGFPCEVLTTRWSRNENLTPDQAQWLFFGRVLFPAFASSYPLWPILMNVGEQNSGKSTPTELLLTLRNGRKSEAQMLPDNKKSLVASLTNQSLICYDNIDGEDDKAFANTLCLVATGGDIDVAQLYKTNELTKFAARTHLMTTARVSPFGRTDLLRRCLKLEVADPRDGSPAVPKDTLLKRVLTNRLAIYAEIFLRTQNILKAHQAHGTDEFRYTSEMVDYERYTLICASADGELAYAQRCWQAYIAAYREEIQDQSGMVYGISLWLGSNPANAGREIIAEHLHGELAAVYAEVGVKLAHQMPHAFDLAIKKHATQLRKLNWRKIKREGNNVHTFTPSAKDLASCRELYITALESMGRRPSSGYSGAESIAKHKAAALREKAERGGEPIGTCDLHDSEFEDWPVAGGVKKEILQ